MYFVPLHLFQLVYMMLAWSLLSLYRTAPPNSGRFRGRHSESSASVSHQSSASPPSVHPWTSSEIFRSSFLFVCVTISKRRYVNLTFSFVAVLSPLMTFIFYPACTLFLTSLLHCIFTLYYGTVIFPPVSLSFTLVFCVTLADFNPLQCIPLPLWALVHLLPNHTTDQCHLQT